MFTLTTASRANSFNHHHHIFLNNKTNRFSFTVSASKDDSKLNSSWEQMELKFGRLLGEDPKLTLAKIAGRRANPDVSYLEIEKQFRKKKFHFDDEIVEEFQRRPKHDSLNLTRPVPKKGTKFEEDVDAYESQNNKPRLSSQGHMDGRNKTTSIPNVILRKPSAAFPEDDIEVKKPLMFKLKPNLTLRMNQDDTKENFSDIILLKKPEPTQLVTESESDSDKLVSGDPVASSPSSTDTFNQSPGTSNNSFLQGPGTNDELIVGVQPLQKRGLESTVNQPSVLEAELQRKPPRFDQSSTDEIKSLKEKETRSNNAYAKVEIAAEVGLQSKPPRSEHSATVEHQPLREKVASFSNGSTETENPAEVKLQNRPPRLDQSSNDESQPRKETAASASNGHAENEASTEVGLQNKPPRPRLNESTTDESKPIKENTADLSSAYDQAEKFVSAVPVQERENNDWLKAEYACNSGGREEVELVSCSSRGFVVSFGSLIGFLPYRNLITKWKFLAFESWLRKKGLDPSMYRKNLGIVGYESRDKNLPKDTNPSRTVIVGKLSPAMKLEELLAVYDEEKMKFLSSFIGLRTKVHVEFADRNSRKLIFSVKPKEKEEIAQKKRSLMAKLNVGDVVTCCIKKITYFGIFVEVEGVPALIHQSEVSWDATMDPFSFFKLGQIVEAKVHQLDFTLHRIMLSLKEITHDPMVESLKSVIGESDDLDGSLEAADANIEWPDVESLIKELAAIEGVQSVSKGRFLLSPGLAPTFQVYMASMVQNQYKLLARSENKVQEVIVRSSLDKEEMKAAILTCTNRVE